MRTSTAAQSGGQPRAGPPDHADSASRVLRVRRLTGELAAEFLGTFAMVLFGVGADAQVLAGGLGSHDSIAWAWGLGVMVGLYIALRVSGGHINPAVTIAQAMFQGFPWRKVLPYSIAQFTGAFVAGLLVRWNYTEIIAKVDPGHTIKTQGIFATLPGNGTAPVSDLGALRDQIIATALLVFLIFALTDTRNSAPLANLAPLVVGLAVVGMVMALGADAGYAINPARDLGPRIAIFLTGYRGAFRDQYGHLYFWVPIAGPVLGGIVGATLYKYGLQRYLPAEPDPSGLAAHRADDDRSGDGTT